MDYYTTAAQEIQMAERQRVKHEQEQDRMRHSLYRFTSQTVKKEDRMFLIENGRIYLGEVKPENECPSHPVSGGDSYGVDFMFVKEVEGFLKRNKNYVIIFQMKNGYSHRAGIYPARMTSMSEDLVLEDTL